MEAGFVYYLFIFTISSFHHTYPHGEKHQDGDENSPSGGHTVFTSAASASTHGLTGDRPAAHRHRQQCQHCRDQVGARRYFQNVPPRPVVHAVAAAPDCPPRAGLLVGGARAVVCAVLAACEL